MGLRRGMLDHDPINFQPQLHLVLQGRIQRFLIPSHRTELAGKTPDLAAELSPDSKQQAPRDEEGETLQLPKIGALEPREKGKGTARYLGVMEALELYARSPSSGWPARQESRTGCEAEVEQNNEKIGPEEDAIGIGGSSMPKGHIPADLYRRTPTPSCYSNTDSSSRVDWGWGSGLMCPEAMHFYSWHIWYNQEPCLCASQEARVLKSLGDPASSSTSFEIHGHILSISQPQDFILQDWPSHPTQEWVRGAPKGLQVDFGDVLKQVAQATAKGQFSSSTRWVCFLEDHLPFNLGLLAALGAPEHLRGSETPRGGMREVPLRALASEKFPKARRGQPAFRKGKRVGGGAGITPHIHCFCEGRHLELGQELVCETSEVSKASSQFSLGPRTNICSPLPEISSPIQAAVLQCFWLHIKQSRLSGFGTRTGFVAPQLADRLLWDFTLLSCYKSVQHVTVLNTGDNCNTMKFLIIHLLKPDSVSSSHSSSVKPCSLADEELQSPVGGEAF
ncbi:hypothetical protein AAY473_012765 [Plecturocebus cupreus]